VTLATVNGAGTGWSDGFVETYELSPDGTKVLFASRADDLGPVDHNRPPTTSKDDADNDLYVRNLSAGTTALVSVNAAGADSGDVRTDGGVLSDDGTKIRFYSAASDLVPGDTNGLTDAFERNLTTGVTTRIQLSPTASVVPQYSADGTKIAFTTNAADLGFTDSDCVWPPLPPNPCDDVFVRNLTTGVTTMVSHNAAGTDSGDGPSQLLAFSADGTRVLFQSWASNLGPADAGFDIDVYLADLTTGITTLVSVNAAGTDGMDTGNVLPFVVASSDLSIVSLGTSATNLDPADTNGHVDVYVRDLAAGTTSLVSHALSSTNGGNKNSIPVAFSPNSHMLVFTSLASDLVATDTNATTDAFLATLTG
jgi:Tol biopolymer transport system component